VPSLFWRGWALRLNPPGLFAPVPYRAVLSALLLLAGTADLDYRHARALLGDTPTGSDHSSHFTQGLRRAGALDTVISVLGRLADTLDERGSPIDYARRRMLAEPAFDEGAWRDRCLEIGRRGLTRRHQVRFARFHLAELLTGTHPSHLPGPARMAAPGSARYAEFAAAVPEPLEAYLRCCAEQILNRAGIDEPVEWEPPFDWVADVAWPGPDPAATPRGILWARTSTRSPSTPPAEPGTTAGPAPPGAEELRAWAEQGLSPRRIAAITGCPRPLIARLLAEAGLARPTARDVLSTLDPAWLREQYEARHRTFDEIAAELGIHSCELNAHARTLGITTRRGGASRRHILAGHGGPAAFPSAVWAAFTGHRADQHIRRILATPGHPNLSRAASALGARQSSLTYQIRRVERAVGAEILRCDDNGGGITFTPAGEQFARDVRPVLDLLDHATTGGDHDRRRELAK
jgi:hypothetical protein